MCTEYVSILYNLVNLDREDLYTVKFLLAYSDPMAHLSGLRCSILTKVLRSKFTIAKVQIDPNRQS